MAVELTKDHIKAIRKADTISFHWNHDSDMVITSKKGELEQRAVIKCDFKQNRYDDKYDKIKSAFYMISSAQYHQNWKTITSFLKPGDKLTLVWNVGSYSSPVLKDHGFVADTLDLQVQRGDKYLNFFIGCQICLNDSSARMVTLA